MWWHTVCIVCLVPFSMSLGSSAGITLRCYLALQVDLGSLFGQQQQQQHGDLDPLHVSEVAEAAEEPEMQFSVGSL